MGHMIDETTGKPAIAYVGAEPWHKLGTRLTPDAPIDVWAQEAGLAYEVGRAPVQFERAGLDGLNPTVELRKMAGRDVLYRSDTGAALSVVGASYKIVQPSEVLEFFAELTKLAGFELETMGALSDGKRIWGLAKVNDGAPIVGQDQVRPYVLLATSYDGTMATTAKFTAIRVVCNNTLTMSVGGPEMNETGFRQTKYEDDTEGRAVSSMVRIPHSKTFDAEKVRLALGIVSNVWDKWLIEARLLAEQRMTDGQAEVFATKLLDSFQPKNDERRRVDVQKSRSFENIMGLFNGGQIGAELTGGKNRWAMMNAISEEIDHHRGKSDNTRITSAWFGVGEGIKNRAFKMLASDDQFAKLEPA